MEARSFSRQGLVSATRRGINAKGDNVKIGERIADWLIERAARTPYVDLPGYMVRTWLIPYVSAGSAAVPGDGTGPVSWRRPVAKVLQLFGIAVRVHQILRSDRGRDPHLHPWSFVTIILRGGYREELYNDIGDLTSSRWHGPGSVLFRRSSTLHRLLIPYGETATTLFITGPKNRTWGFMTRAGFVSHTEYNKRGDDAGRS
jgi:hypothetical protein